MNSNQIISIIHIHNNHLFLSNLDYFENPNFQNDIYFLGKKGNYTGVYANRIQYFGYTPSELREIIRKCNSANVVVLYNLDFAKSYIANRTAKNVIVCWRFFGEELYGRIPEVVLSKTTLQNLKYGIAGKLGFKQRLIFLLDIIRFGKTYNKEFVNSISRIDFFLGLVDEEYDFLKRYFPNLPNFIQLPYLLNTGLLHPYSNKEKKIIIGNNRGFYNNHLDVLNIIAEYLPAISTIKFILLFNYGQENDYTHKVFETAGKIPNVEVIKDMLPLTEFQNLYHTVGTLVLNGYRQMAMANIFTAFRSGVKVYLNKKNIIYTWLKNLNFIVFSLEDFQSDIISGNILLSKEEIDQNLHQIEEIKLKFGLFDFQQKIQRKLLHVI